MSMVMAFADFLSLPSLVCLDCATLSPHSVLAPVSFSARTLWAVRPVLASSSRLVRLPDAGPFGYFAHKPV